MLVGSGWIWIVCQRIERRSTIKPGLKKIVSKSIMLEYYIHPQNKLKSGIQIQVIKASPEYLGHNPDSVCSIFLLKQDSLRKGYGKILRSVLLTLRFIITINY